MNEILKNLFNIHEDCQIGKHRDIADSYFDVEQLKMGIEIEKEHTNDSEIAKNIAKDHLKEDPYYYSHLKEMEKKYNKKESIVNHIQNLNIELSEGLNKKQYNKLIKDIELGVELEVINTQGNVSPDAWLDIDIEKFLTNFKVTLDEFNNLVNDCNNFLYGYDPKELPHQVNEPKTNFEGQIYSLKNTIEVNINYCIKIAEKTVLRYEDIIKNISDDQNFWYSGLNFEDENKNEENGQQLNLFSDKLTYSKYKGLLKLRTNIKLMQALINDLKNQIPLILISANDLIHIRSLELEHTVKISKSKFKELVEGTELARLMDEIESVGKGSWDIQGDSSLSEGRIELASPVLSYSNFIEYIPLMMGELFDEGFTADETCGYHIGISSKSIDIKKLIETTIEKYEDKGFNLLTSFLVATQQSYKTVYRYNDGYRDENYEHSQSLYRYLYERNIDLKYESMEELLYSKKYDYLVGLFKMQKFANLNLKHDDYVELRVLGGDTGFHTLGDTDLLKRYLYDAISQAFGGVRDLSNKEIVHTVLQFQRMGTEGIKKLKNAKPKSKIKKYKP